MIMKYELTVVAIMALVTYLPRVIPMALIRKNIESKFIKNFLRFVPFAVLSSLTFPDIFSSTTFLISAIAGTLVSLLLAFKGKPLVVVATVAILVAYISEVIMSYIKM